MKGGGLPVDLAVEAVRPEDAVVGHVQVQSYGVLLGGHHLGVLSLHRVDAPDLVAVGDQQVRTLPLKGRINTQEHMSNITQRIRSV